MLPVEMPSGHLENGQDDVVPGAPEESPVEDDLVNYEPTTTMEAAAMMLAPLSAIVSLSERKIADLQDRKRSIIRELEILERGIQDAEISLDRAKKHKMDLEAWAADLPLPVPPPCAPTPARNFEERGPSSGNRGPAQPRNMGREPHGKFQR